MTNPIAPLEQGHVGEPPHREIDGALRVLRRPDDLEGGVGSDHAGQRLTDDLLVIGDQHPDPLLTEQDGGFLVRIADDGVGFKAPETLQSARGHLGVPAMRERAEMAGGWCQLTSLPGDGTTVEFWVPGVAPQAQEPSEAEDDEVPFERRSDEAASVPVSVGGPTTET